MAEVAVPARYPVQLAVDYPERQSRRKALLRLPLTIPLLIFAELVQGGMALAIWAAILVRGRIPRWLFDFQVALQRWQLRAGSYFVLLTDEYPPFEGGYPIRYDVQYPERLSRWRLVIWKLITSIPHFLVLAVLTLTLIVVVPVAWIAILFAGSFPQGLHGYVAGVLRWGARVQAYVLSLTDEFPPFSLSADAGPGGRDSYVVSSVIGVLATGGLIAGIVLLAIFARGDEIAMEVSYQRLLAREVTSGETRVAVDSLTVELGLAADPADEFLPFLAPQPDHRFVLFVVFVENDSDRELRIRTSDFRLEDDEGDGHDRYLAFVNGRVDPVRLMEGTAAASQVIFELPTDVRPKELRYSPERFAADTVVYEFQ